MTVRSSLLHREWLDPFLRHVEERRCAARAEANRVGSVVIPAR